MLAQLVLDLQLALSTPRLEAYRPTDGSDLDMVVNYLWNMDLAESLVPSIHAFEVALRNSIHSAVSQHYANELWYFTPGILEPNQLKDVASAYGRVYKKGQPITGRLIAAVMFGFWSSLLNSPYEQILWSQNNFAALSAAFPNAYNARGNRLSRDEIQQRLQLINVFRNRVFHHEKIYEWNYFRGNPDLPILRTADQDHRDIHEAIQWLSPALHLAIHAVDDFSTAWASRRGWKLISGSGWESLGADACSSSNA